jgi:hypothetical protein
MNINFIVPESTLYNILLFFKIDFLLKPFSGTIRFWQLDVANRKIRPTDINTGVVKRIVKCMTVSDSKYELRNFFISF